VRDIKSKKLIVAKGLLFLLLALFSASLLFRQTPDAKTLFLILVCIWSFCRLYYFTFYVLERYVDPSLRYSGLVSLLRHLGKRREDFN